MMQAPRIEVVDVAPLPRVNPLFRDYVKAAPSLRDFYQWDPRERQDRLLQCLTRRSYPREQLVAILSDQNRAWGAGEAILTSIGRLRDPQAVMVVTGQQVGLLGGPLYTLYKALTAVALARQMESHWQIPCLPLFWMDSEDTDFAEIDHLYMPDAQDQVAPLRYAPLDGFGSHLPATHILTSEIGGVLAAVEEATFPGPVREKILTLLRDCYRPGATLVSAFARLLTSLLGERGPILVDPADPRLKALACPLFLQETGTAPASARLVQTAGEKLRGLGYRPHIRLTGEGPNLFYLEGGRRPLKGGVHGVLIAGTRRWLERQELQRLVEEAPEHFSPNVALRPLMESFLFPAVAHVGGPHEIAYYSQLRGLYDHFGIPMPCILPRASLTLVEGRIERLLKKHDLTFGALRKDHEGLMNQVLRRSLPQSFASKRERALQTILKNFGELKEMVATLDPTLAPRVGSAEGLVKKQMEELERLLLRSFKRRNHEVQNQVFRILAHLLPRGELQERVYGLIPYLFRHGPSLIDLIGATIDRPGWEHRLVYLGPSIPERQSR
ncbi:MAG: bacillithiol biosynthesis cysteine-adding enzyme BshC [Candidatus Methylomirabilales bacterium]